MLWFQRQYHSIWFKGYNPMSNDAYDTPYDYDHLVPYSHLINSGSPVQINSLDWDGENQFLGSRYTYINSIGNFRAWPSWANRSDKDKCHTEKLRMIDANIDIDKDAKEFALHSTYDFMKASLINSDDFDYWLDAGGSPRNWNEKRRIAWQQAVEKRVMFLFREFYVSFGFSKWNYVLTE